MEMSVASVEKEKEVDSKSGFRETISENLVKNNIADGEAAAKKDDEEDEEDKEYDEEAASTTIDDKEEDEKNRLEGAYDPSKYDSLSVSIEIQNLFAFITHYTSQMIEISTKLKPFIPDYIPAVGDVDPFIKIPPPDEQQTSENDLGLTILDEPAVEQSDAALLHLKLKAISKEVDSLKDSSLRETVVQSSGTTAEIETWIENIKNLHETTARPDSVTSLANAASGVGGTAGTGATVGPSGGPFGSTKFDIEELMQEWHGELENALSVYAIPTPELQCTLEEYINIICAILDIPVQANKIASLHLLFSLYHEFKNSQHFKKMN